MIPVPSWLLEYAPQRLQTPKEILRILSNLFAVLWLLQVLGVPLAKLTDGWVQPILTPWATGVLAALFLALVQLLSDVQDARAKEERAGSSQPPPGRDS